MRFIRAPTQKFSPLNTLFQTKETEESTDGAPSEEEDSLSQLMNTLFSGENEAPEGNEDTTKRFNFDDLNGLNFGR